MRIVVPYNEILPHKRAHDLFLFQECVELAKAGCDVHLLCGKGSLPDAALFQHYATKAPITIHRLPILRKNNSLNLSWNLPFFYAAQRKIEALCPDIVLLSVLKQAHYHLMHRLPGIQYIYEAHEVAAYPNTIRSERYETEKEMLQLADLIIVTTNQLAEILQAPPYSLLGNIEVIPLAVSHKPLPSLDKKIPSTVTYVGQLYPEQGVAQLLEAMDGLDDVWLKIIGGLPEEIAALNRHQRNVKFMGFVPPSQLRQVVAQTHAFVAPFQLVGRMPYVAHTKLYEYAAWGRPIIAPNSPIVREHLSSEKGVLLYDSKQELKSCLQQIRQLCDSPTPPLSWAQRIGLFKKALQQAFDK